MMLSVLLAAALVFTPEDGTNAFATAETFVGACTPRDAGTIRSSLAASWLLDEASARGANARRDVFQAPTPQGERTFTNLYAEFPANETDAWVVVVSHFDTKPGVNCPGANDGASTSALLVSLAGILARNPHAFGNIMLIWTDGEECQGAVYAANDGFQGSERAVRYLRDKDRAIRAVICLDMLGDRDLHISIPANGTPSLARIVRIIATRLGDPQLVSQLDQNVKDDHVAFLDAGYPAIDLIDFDYGPGNCWWHTKEDTVDKLSPDSLYRVGRLVCELLNTLR